MSPPERRTPPGEGGAHQIACRRIDGTQYRTPDPRCTAACSTPCPWATCPVPLATTVASLVDDLTSTDYQPDIQFDVFGTPFPQGSKKAFAVNGRAIVKEASGTNHAAWRNAVAQAAHDRADALQAPLDGPLGLIVEFRFRMPKSRSKAARLAERVWKTTAPDTSKLVRALEDGLQAGGLIVDDARFAFVTATKVEVTGWTGATITVTRLTGVGS